MKNQRGFGVLEILLAIIVIGIVGVVGLFVFDNIRNARSVEIKGKVIAEPVSVPKAPLVDKLSAATLPAISTAGWLPFHEKTWWFSYSYPKDWSVKNDGSFKTTTKDSKLVLTRQLITSPNGNNQVRYMEKIYESGAQIELSAGYDPDHLATDVVDCKEDIRDDRLLQQIEISNSMACLYKYADNQYAYRFNGLNQTFQINILLGSKSSAEENKAALQILTGIVKSFTFSKTNQIY